MYFRFLLFWFREGCFYISRISFLPVFRQPMDFRYLTLCRLLTHLYLTDVFFMVATQSAPMTSLSRMTSQLCFPLHLFEISNRLSTGQHWVFLSGKCRVFRTRICLLAGHTSLTSSFGCKSFMAIVLILSVKRKCKRDYTFDQPWKNNFYMKI